ncbi:MAG: twin-arginine translocation signal domain-containing protein [Verrucomicrobiaceae bacterium]|nr:MAG: twin-arginine translocation signal domain-containing protein [Verrucomicrobiaceae bacterium]
MTNPSHNNSQSQGLNRRQFMKHASVTGAGTALAMASETQVSLLAAPDRAGAPGDEIQTPVKTVPLAPPDKQSPSLVLPEPVERKVGWALVGLGQLSLEEILPAFSQCRLTQPVALVSGHPDKARQVAKAYGVKENAILNYDSFDSMVENKEIEVVYIVLPNSMHAEFTIRALQAGKHVICEKPMAASVEECHQMIAAAEKANRKLMIAYRLHYEPLNRKVMEMCSAKALGKIKLFSSSNCQNVQAPNIRLSTKTAGGPVGDVGVYSINAARYVIGEEPVDVYAVEHRPPEDPRFAEVPESVTFVLRYPSGVLAHCECSFGTAGSQRYRAVCEDGFIEMDPAFPYRGLKLSVSRIKGSAGAPEKADIQIPQINQFAAEMDYFSECILKNKDPRTPGSMGLADMRIITAIRESARTGQPVKI